MAMLTVIKDARRDERKDFADHVRDLADRYENGDLSNVLFVYNNVEGGCYGTSADFDDRWRMIGALEYAKLRMIEAE